MHKESSTSMSMETFAEKEKRLGTAEQDKEARRLFNDAEKFSPKAKAPPKEDEAFARIAEVREKNEEALLHLEGVTGIASSFRMRKGQLTAEPCLTALVEKKLPTPPKGAKVPQEIDAVKTDVVETGKIEALHFTYGVRPARPGFSIGHHLITAGTFGALVQDKENHDILILSNNHVLARSDLASIGDPVLQPGPYDGGTYPLHQIATLTKMVPLSRNWNNVDAAVAKPTEMRNVIASAIYLGIPTGVGQAYRGWWAKKVGRTTQYTIGYIYSTDAAIWVYGYPFGPALFRDQIWTTGMLAGGDSGSLLRDYYYNRAIGLSFAGSYYYSFHNNIANVLMSLGVDMVTAL